VGISLSIFMIAVGAVLAWAVDAEVSGIDIQVAGIILVVVGMIGGALLGGFLATVFGLGDPIDEFFDISTWVAAIVGSLLILFTWNAIRDRA